MSKPVEFQTVQKNMAAHLRNPDQFEGPAGIEDRRLGIYRELIFNNIEGFISGAFPVLRGLYTEENWLAMVRKFIVNHQSHSPYFLHISQEFLGFLQNEYQAVDTDPQFLLELAHYEWVELALDVSEADEPKSVSVHGELGDQELLEQQLNLSPVAWPLSYEYPVHRISPDYQPDGAPESATFLVVYRHQEDIKFLESNAITVRLLLLISESKGGDLAQVFESLAKELNYADVSQLQSFGIGLIRDLMDKNVVFIA